MKSVTKILSQFPSVMFLFVLAVLATPANALPEAEIDMEADEVVETNTVYFPQFQMFETVKNEQEMSDQISGRLELVDECLRLVTRQQTYLLIWPGWYDFTIAGREIVVGKVNANSEVAHLKIGNRLSVSGAEIVYFPANALQYKIPDQCLGPFLAVGEIVAVRPEVNIIKESPPIAKKPQKPSKEAIKPARMVMPPKRHFQQKFKSSAQSGKQLKKLEIMLEKSILK